MALALLLLTWGTAGVASAQSPELVTDRPDQTESATVVPRGLLQVETGLLIAHESQARRYELPGTLVRIGLGGRTELRVGHAGIVGGAGSRGAGDSEVGAKVNLMAQPDRWRPELAILGGLSLPTGDDGFSSEGVDPSFLVSFANDLSPRVALGYNVGAAWESSPDRPARAASVVFSSSLGFSPTDKLGTFLELFGARPTAGDTGTALSVDTGVTFLLTKTIQLDAFAGKRLRGSADDRFVGTGLSFRLPR
jgi:hypothetical protein